MTPTICGWVWNIPFYPITRNRRDYRSLKGIFWYDSSNDLEFTKHTEEYQILIPEFLIQSSKEEIDYVHANLERIIKTKELIVGTDNKGNWRLRPYITTTRFIEYDLEC
jgi:hypothetical protein